LLNEPSAHRQFKNELPQTKYRARSSLMRSNCLRRSSEFIAGAPLPEWP
jgi:hypothetical protein